MSEHRKLSGEEVYERTLASATSWTRRGRDRRSPGDATLVADQASARAAYDEYRGWIRATLGLETPSVIRCNWINEQAYAYVRISPDSPEKRYRINDDGSFTPVEPDPYLYPKE